MPGSPGGCPAAPESGPENARDLIESSLRPIAHLGRHNRCSASALAKLTHSTTARRGRTNGDKRMKARRPVSRRKGCWRSCIESSEILTDGL
jgi:hypothetical protein